VYAGCARRAVFAQGAATIGGSSAPDIRDTARADHQRRREDEVRVPTAKETADTIRRAQYALAEIDAREAEDARRGREEARTQQLARWHHDGQADAERAREYDHARSL
jgi:hypothetical protein